jgi:hypothetical protein
MLVVKVELHSAVDGRTEELGRLCIANVGGTRTRGKYNAAAFRKGKGQTREDLAVGALRGLQADRARGVIRASTVDDYARLSDPVWNLVVRALRGMGYE